MGESSERHFAASVYVTPVLGRPLPQALLRDVVATLQPDAPWRLTATDCGLIVAFACLADAQRFLALDLAALLGVRVHVTHFTARDLLHKQNVLICNVPWLIPLEDIAGALSKQGVASGYITRVRRNVKVEILDPLQCERLLQNGLNFFGAARFTVLLDRSGQPNNWNHSRNSPASSNNSSHDNVLQCYRCQGFWHIAANCRHLLRCVRCGEPHNVEFCTVPRENAICCNCGGPHHAAYKNCPIRLRLLNATPVNITLSAEPSKNYSKNTI